MWSCVDRVVVVIVVLRVSGTLRLPVPPVSFYRNRDDNFMRVETRVDRLLYAPPRCARRAASRID